MLNNMIFLTVGFILLLIWVSGLSYVTWKYVSHYQSLTKGVEDKNLQMILEALLKDIRIAQREVKTLQTQTEILAAAGKLHLQKIGLLRFNPFNDTGGNQSFILAFVDAEDTGVVISGLYGRSGTRWYAKRVVNGKGVDHALSAEEKKAMDLAKNS
ncbi:hypothetical protein BH11PAT1_BH11PAT1_5090 [soil metagenome]